MDISKQKEQFSVAYVNAIAALVGLNNAQLSVDDDSVDLLLKGKGFSGKVRNPQVELQLKCTSRSLVSGEVIKFPLSLKNYNDLRGDDVVCPRYLVVLMVPDQVDEWSEQLDDEIVLRNSCYWVSIRNHPKTNNSTSVTIDIPIDQKLTKGALLNLMNLASEGEYL